MPSIRNGSDMLQGKLSKFFISIVLELVLVVFLAQCKQNKQAWNNSRREKLSVKITHVLA